MRPSHYKALDRWLAAERDDRSDSADIADAALLEMFEALPLLAPPAGFADRVLARAGLQEVRLQEVVMRSVFASRLLRLALVLGLIALGLGAIWLPPTLRALVGLWSLSGTVELGVRVVAAGSRGLATVLGIGDWVFSLWRAFAQPLMAPQVMGALTLCLLASGLAFRFLRDQITGERSWNHVHPV